MTAGKVRGCKDCEPGSKRPAPHPGPRCATHHKARRKHNRSTAHERRVKETYSLQPGQYGLILEAQGGVCAICGPRTGRRGVYKSLAVDHDHSCCSGKTSCGRCVRGLLCGTCNTMLGRQHDDIETFVRAVEYLRNPPARTVLVGLVDEQGVEALDERQEVRASDL